MSFKFHLDHLQNSLFGIWNMLPESQLKRLKQSKEASFYNIIFVNINEIENHYNRKYRETICFPV